ncbi:hypothetical protein SASPL_155860 [Salvia splendens]|uniref:Uncharacterized protein n=1 Tax=Salvia splendens TaxID=180675 RepID=A0A8X8YYL7_SALSN|nr:hypothetical protein SASPL_155860 [Salvia splendens]
MWLDQMVQAFLLVSQTGNVKHCSQVQLERMSCIEQFISEQVFKAARHGLVSDMLSVLVCIQYPFVATSGFFKFKIRIQLSLPWLYQKL